MLLLDQNGTLVYFNEPAEAIFGTRFDADFRDSTEALTPAEAAEAMRRYDAIIPTLGDGFSAAAFAGNGLRTRLLANFGAGYNHIDLDAARAAGVENGLTQKLAHSG